MNNFEQIFKFVYITDEMFNFLDILVFNFFKRIIAFMTV